MVSTNFPAQGIAARLPDEELSNPRVVAMLRTIHSTEIEFGTTEFRHSIKSGTIGATTKKRGSEQPRLGVVKSRDIGRTNSSVIFVKSKGRNRGRISSDETL
jgi:hypothetical protein